MEEVQQSSENFSWILAAGTRLKRGCRTSYSLRLCSFMLVACLLISGGLSLPDNIFSEGAGGSKRLAQC